MNFHFTSIIVVVYCVVYVCMCARVYIEMVPWPVHMLL